MGYCRAVVVDGWAFVSGTTGHDHAGGRTPEDVSAQCRLALDHITAALAEAGASLADVVRVRYILPRPSRLPALLAGPSARPSGRIRRPRR